MGGLDIPLTQMWVHEMLKDDLGMQFYYEVYGRSSKEDPSPIVKALEYKKI